MISKDRISIKKIWKWINRSEDESLFLTWYYAQPISAKVGFCAAFVTALLTHLNMYSTLILEEHLPGFRRADDMASFGRWFHRHVNSLTFFYMNWVTGLLQTLFLALSVFVVIKAFNIKNVV